MWKVLWIGGKSQSTLQTQTPRNLFKFAKRAMQFGAGQRIIR